MLDRFSRTLRRLDAAIRAAAPVVWQRLREPRNIPAATRKVLAAARSGELLDRLLLRAGAGGPQDAFYPEWYARYAALSAADREAVSRALGAAAALPRFSIVVRGASVGAPAIESLRRQLYANWELAASAAAATGDFVVGIDAADELAEHALFVLASYAAGADLVYSDEDRIDARGRHHAPSFKPDWNPDLALSLDYVGRACAVRRSLLCRLEASPFDAGLALRAAEAGARVRHAPFVLHHRRSVEPPPVARRIEWPIPAPPPLVTAVVPTRDGGAVLKKCVESLLEKTAYRPVELLVVDNQSRDAETLAYLAQLRQSGRARVIAYDAPFNFSAINNLAVREANGELVALLNDDLEIVESGWLTEMVSQALRPGIGAVGARLLYPDGSVQHAGLVLGLFGSAAHAHKFLPGDARGSLGRAQAVQNFSAVTAACLVIRRETYQRAGGFDERFAVSFNDVDFCLRVRELGLRNLWTPFATLVHHESRTRGADERGEKKVRFQREAQLLQERWGAALREDPAYNPNLSLESTDFALAWPPRVKSPW